MARRLRKFYILGITAEKAFSRTAYLFSHLAESLVLESNMVRKHTVYGQVRIEAVLYEPYSPGKLTNTFKGIVFALLWV